MRPRFEIAAIGGLLALLLLFVAPAGPAVANGDNGDDEHEKKISFEKLPRAVRATLKREAAGGKIEEIEVEEEDGVVVFEADVTIKGKECEIEIAKGGTLLVKKLGVDDEDQDDEDENGED